MRRLRQPARTANSLLRLAIRQVSAVPVLTSSILLGLAPASQALTLGDISVRSALGQRLDATVPVRLGAGETLASTCVVPGQQGSDLRGVPGTRVTAPDATREGAYELRVASDEALYEPMYELELRVQCPGSPVVVRQYVLMLDLPAVVAASATEVAAPGAAPASTGGTTLTTAVTTAAAPARRPSGAPTRPTSSIEAGSRYRVAEGDTLSGLAARVAGRQVSLQAMADAIQAANPAAFIRNDANLIKLGSEITIPAASPAAAPPAPAAAGSGPAAPSAEPPAPTLPEILDTVPLVPVPVATEAAEAAPTTPPVEAALPVEATPAALPPAAAPPAAVATPVAAADEPSPLVAAGAGIVFGLLVSSLLWFRGRLPARKRPAPAVAPRVDPPAVANTAALAVTPAPLVTRAAEPGFSVSFTPAQEDALAAEFADDPEPAYAPPAPPPPRQTAPTPPPAPAAEDITSELEGLFDGTDTTIQKRLDEERTVAAHALASAEDGASEVDFPVGDPTGEESTLCADTVDQPRPNLEPTVQTPTVDLRTLAASATKDQQQAQTLLEALTLLERDYEEELTASQVLDMSAMRAALGGELDEPTQISEAKPRVASARKKSR